MSESTELVRHEMPTMDMARVFSESGFFPAARDAAKACVKILAGRELGLGPVASMQNIHCFDGKVTLGVHVMAALIKRSGRYDYHVTAATREQCIIEYFDVTGGSAGGSMGTSSFTIEEAKAAGLMGKDNWKKYPEDMLYSRAMARGARRYCPDVFMGAAYTPEEFIDGEFTAVPATPPPPPPPDVDFDNPTPTTGETHEPDTTASTSMPEI